VVLAAFAVAHLLALGSNVLELSFLEQARQGLVTEADGEANDNRQLLIAGLTLVTYIACAITIGMFLHRANKNARALAGGEIPLEYTPGWTVGWFFVPLLNLWKPYAAVSEMFTVSRPAKPSMLGAWWAAWIVMLIVGRISQKLVLGASTIDEFVTSDYVSSAHSLVAVAAAAAALWMVRTLHALQQAHYESGRPSMP
jgi:hypothetical protein